MSRSVGFPRVLHRHIPDTVGLLFGPPPDKAQLFIDRYGKAGGMDGDALCPAFRQSGIPKSPSDPPAMIVSLDKKQGHMAAFLPGHEDTDRFPAVIRAIGAQGGKIFRVVDRTPKRLFSTLRVLRRFIRVRNTSHTSGSSACISAAQNLLISMPFSLSRVLLSQKPCQLHRHDLQNCTAGHHIEPSLAHLLRFGDGRGDGGKEDQQRAGAADDGGHADEREQPRCAAAVDGVLNRFI